jgi:ATP-binding cassette subfamily F protein 3
MESCDALLAAIDNFGGAVIMVTHNEMFLHALAQRLIVFQNDRLHIFDGSYQRFLDKGGWQDDNKTNSTAQTSAPQAATPIKRTKKALRQQRSAIIAERSRVLRPLQKKATAMEDEIEKNEAELNRLNDSMQQASRSQNGTEITEISRAIHACQQAIDRLFEQLEDVTRKMEICTAEFENRLNQLDTEPS